MSAPRPPSHRVPDRAPDRAADSAPDRAPDRATVLKALDAVLDPVSGKGLVAAGLVHGLVLRPGRAGFVLEAPATDTALYQPVRLAAEAALAALPGVDEAQVVLTAQATTPVPPDRSPPTRAAAAMKPASGKGGVGKSTVAVNLAAALSAMGYRVGLLDADVYGPSIPRMLGLQGRPELNADKKLVPPEAFGIKAVSIGLLVDDGAPMIWRGPMASSAVGQLLFDVAWGSAAEPLDILVIDMPPGTGDVQLTLAQRIRLDGAVIVSTPQEVALIDVRRGAAMFAKTATPILGVVENMAYFPDPATGEPIEIFGRGGAQRVAAEIGAPFLGEVAIDVGLRRAGDAGEPVLASDSSGASARAFVAIAAAVAERLKSGALQKPPPSITVTD
jgi:ATP-binding protein involved in chromosome partitioning